MRKIRINNEFTHHWAIKLDGAPVDLTSLPKRLYLIHPLRTKEIEQFDTNGNIISVELTKKLLNIVGVYSLELHYELPDPTRENGIRYCAVDVRLCQIVPTTEQADEVAEFTTTTDMAFGFQGKSAYEVWLETHEGTLEDYENWLQKPATDAVSLIEDKIETLDTAIQQEEQRELAEGVRLSNEQSRVDAEAVRATAEDNRISAETSRASNEDHRTTKETARKTAEELRVEAEILRQASESERNENEGLRVNAESLRATAESSRELAEGLRVDAEILRQASESERNENEGLRVNAESLRATAESSRELAEGLRVDAELLRQSNTQEAILNTENATENANNAATNANDARLAIEDDLGAKAFHGYPNIEVAKTLKQVDEGVGQLDDAISGKIDVLTQVVEDKTTQLEEDVNLRLDEVEALKQNKTSQSLQTTSKTIVGAINEVNKIVSIHHADNRAVRRWDSSLSTPIGEAVGDIAFLRELPRILGLGCYLVQDDTTKRKLHRDNHNFYEDGTPALLDGTEGQYMFCWNAFYYTNWEEGGFEYEAISLQPIIGKKSYFIPGGGYSAIGHGVIDRDTLTLCSVVNSTPRYRGGNNAVLADTLAGLDDPQTTMLGMPATVYGIHTALAYARKRGDQWSACWFVARSAVEILISIIYGNRHTQSAVLPKDVNGLYQGGFGAGLTAIGDANWSNYNGYYPLVPTNAGVELGDLCGSFDYTIPSADGTAYHVTGIPSFFGLKNFFGHLWFGVAGLNINAKEEVTEAYIMPSMYGGWNYNSLEGMLKAGELPRVGGYISKLNMNLLCALPIEVGASASTKYADNFYTNAATSWGFRARWGGGHAYNGTNAGAFYTHSYNTATTAYALRSVPLCFFEEDPIVG